MTARQKARAGCYYALGALWIVLLAAVVLAGMVVLMGVWATAAVLTWIGCRVALIWAGVI